MKILLSLALVLFPLLSFSASSPPPSQGNPRADAIKLHEKMAKLHQDAAECLKAGKPMDECREMMRKNCPMGEIPQCSALSQEELRRHAKTHQPQMGGTRGFE